MIKERINNISSQLPEGCRIVAVSKYKSVADILEAYDAGQRDFGENYATELRDKHLLLPSDIRWHFIGHLQSKQLKYYIDFVSMIHGIDSIEHLLDVDAAAAKVDRVVDCLLQFHIATEATKSGFMPAEVPSLASLPPTPHLRICGVMGMATNTDNAEQVHSEFHTLHAIFDELKSMPRFSDEYFSEISMGMSSDYQMAIAEGSTMLRLGSTIFGPRDYSIRWNEH